MKEETSLPILQKQKRIIREYYNLPYANKLDNLVEMDEFPERHKLSRMTQEKIRNMNRPIRRKENNLKTSHKGKLSFRLLHC